MITDTILLQGQNKNQRKVISLNVCVANALNEFLKVQKCSEGSEGTYTNCSVPVRKYGLLHALSVGDIPNTHLPRRDNFVLFSVISTQLAEIIFVSPSFSLVLHLNAT